jgi:2-C-methyl-D-erythritol 2,4-cyclodiphosphate synthase
LRIKSGLGYDIHRLEEGRKLFLGGIEVPFDKGLAGHSDGDCLIHAIIDALLGALGHEDIGQCFPDADPAYKDIRSPALLKKVVSKLQYAEARILNIDSMVIAEQPKLGGFIPHMKETLCPILGISQEDLGIKAKTNEGIGRVGKGKAIAAWAIALLQLP